MVALQSMGYECINQKIIAEELENYMKGKTCIFNLGRVGEENADYLYNLEGRQY